jgi:hypothetical protein
MSAHDGLHRFAQHLPGAVQILGEPRGSSSIFCKPAVSDP